MSLWRCQLETSSSDFTKWLVFQELDPEPDVKRQFEHAALAATFESVMSGKQIKIEDRILKYGKKGEDVVKQTPEEMIAVLKQLQKRIETQKNLPKGKQRIVKGERLKG